MKAAAVAVVLAACGSSSGPAIAPAGPHEEVSPRPERDPVVDLACVQRAREGKLMDGVPAELGSFHVAVRGDTLHLHRAGRTLSDADGKRMFDAFVHDVMEPGGILMANSARTSIYTCDDAPKPSCIKVQLLVCQLATAAFAQRLDEALARAGFGDAELSVDVHFHETSGPSCHDRAMCKPKPHYSTKDAVYDPAKPRLTRDPGHGACDDDGDCEASQECRAWYLGGFETLEYRQLSGPEFCGCVEHRCRWFAQ